MIDEKERADMIRVRQEMEREGITAQEIRRLALLKMEFYTLYITRANAFIQDTPPVNEGYIDRLNEMFQNVSSISIQEK